jgi:hypothetical protein
MYRAGDADCRHLSYKLPQSSSVYSGSGTDILRYRFYASFGSWFPDRHLGSYWDFLDVSENRLGLWTLDVSDPVLRLYPFHDLGKYEDDLLNFLNLLVLVLALPLEIVKFFDRGPRSVARPPRRSELRGDGRYSRRQSE